MAIRNTARLAHSWVPQLAFQTPDLQLPSAGSVLMLLRGLQKLAGLGGEDFNSGG